MVVVFSVIYCGRVFMGFIGVNDDLWRSAKDRSLLD